MWHMVCYCGEYLCERYPVGCLEKTLLLSVHLMSGHLVVIALRRTYISTFRGNFGLFFISFFNITFFCFCFMFCLILALLFSVTDRQFL